MRRADGPVTPPISRCGDCGSWVWMIDFYGCRTCRMLWARHGVTNDYREKDQ